MQEKEKEKQLAEQILENAMKKNRKGNIEQLLERILEEIQEVKEEVDELKKEIRDVYKRIDDTIKIITAQNFDILEKIISEVRGFNPDANLENILRIIAQMRIGLIEDIANLVMGRVTCYTELLKRYKYEYERYKNRGANEYVIEPIAELDKIEEEMLEKLREYRRRRIDFPLTTDKEDKEKILNCEAKEFKEKFSKEVEEEYKGWLDFINETSKYPKKDKGEEQ
jgi:seryl-tRNA synthetase